MHERLARVALSAEPFKVYWRAYGGLSGLLLSPYLVAALLITAGCYPFWNSIDLFDGRKSAQLAVDVVPGLMAFSLGGTAILLAFSGKRFVNAIRQGGKPKSLFMKIVANFFHFLLVQTLALVFAFILMAYESSTVLAGFAFFMLAYGVTSAVAAAAMLLNAAIVYNEAFDEDDAD